MIDFALIRANINLRRFNMGFGKRLKEILKNKGITIKELSDMTGISLNTLYSITKRDTSMPTREIIDKITAALQIELSELVTLGDVSNEIFALMEQEKKREDSIRDQLINISKMLNTEALIELAKSAVDMLQDESYKSLYYQNEKFDAYLKSKKSFNNDEAN